MISLAFLSLVMVELSSSHRFRNEEHSDSSSSYIYIYKGVIETEGDKNISDPNFEIENYIALNFMAELHIDLSRN